MKERELLLEIILSSPVEDKEHAVEWIIEALIEGRELSHQKDHQSFPLEFPYQ